MRLIQGSSLDRHFLLVNTRTWPSPINGGLPGVTANIMLRVVWQHSERLAAVLRSQIANEYHEPHASPASSTQVVINIRLRKRALPYRTGPGSGSIPVTTPPTHTLCRELPCDIDRVSGVVAAPGGALQRDRQRTPVPGLRHRGEGKRSVM